MAIKKQFGGQTIRKSGAYSQSQTTPSAGSASAVTGVLMLIGEADAGPGGADEGIQTYSAAALNQLKAKYRTGPLVDAAKAASVPSRTPGINGAGTYLVWKTNNSVQASLVLGNTYATLEAKEYGVGGNRITYQNTLSSETPPTVEGSATVTSFGGLDTQTLLLRAEGGSLLTVTFATPADMPAVLTQINAVTTGVATATSDGGKLVLTLNAGTNLQRNGWGRSLEVQGGTALANLHLTAGLYVADAEPEANIVLLQPRDSITETTVVGGDVTVEIGRDATSSCTAATVAVSATQMTLTQTGATPSSFTLLFSDYPLVGNLVDAINATSGWTADCASSDRGNPSTTLDQVSAVGAYSTLGNMPARVKSDASAVSEFYTASTIVGEATPAVKGLPDTEGRLSLTGGARSPSASSDFDAGLSASLGKDLNAILICASQDSSDDITSGLTDPGSTYDIETLHAMLDTALRLRGSIKNRKEAQGAVGYRKQAKADVFEQAAKLGSELVQLCMEDVQVVDSSNTLTWKQPHIEAALLLGARMGSDIGEPMTHKTLNAQGVGHFVNPSTGVVLGDYDPLIDYDDAIDAGVTSAEPANGSYRWMVDNTTYGADESFVFNRGSVVEAAQYAAKTVRSDAEAFAVGRKNAVISASSLKNRIRQKLKDLFDDQILSPSDDAPQGYVEDTFIVTVTGNTATVQVEIKPCQALDFVFITFTLGDTQQSA